ncbi:hypothetical protein, partial [Vibrio aestuarianus]|uniref:hypothetical protein n=1 Tax=Vibrio aestuarianus TaxID=28171 RepID=UPI00237CCB1F
YREDKKNIHMAMGQFYRDYQCCLDSLNLKGAKAVLQAIQEYESGTFLYTPHDPTGRFSVRSSKEEVS